MGPWLSYANDFAISTGAKLVTHLTVIVQAWEFRRVIE